MAETAVPITAGTGTNIDGYALPDGKIQQGVAIGDGATNGRVLHVGAGGETYAAITTAAAAARNIWADINPYGTLRVTAEPSLLFMDPADGVTIDTNRWTASGSQLPTQGSGQITLAPTVGASVANSSLLVSVPTFLSPGLGFIIFGAAVTLEAAQTSTVNTHRFWGKGQVTSFTYTTPITDGLGFEVNGADGALQCVAFIAGVKYVLNSTVVANITSTLNGLVAGGTPAGTALPSGAVGSAYGAPLTWQGGPHRYAIMVRSDIAFWFVEGTDVPVAVLSYASPQVQTLPVRIHDITNASATSLAHTFTVSAIAVNDTTAGNSTLSDGRYPHRKAQIDTGGSLATRLGPASTDVPSTAAMTTSTAVVLAANTARSGATIFNAASSADSVYLAFAATATTTSGYLVLMAPGGYFEVPYGYNGVISGICATSTATLLVNEITP